jgi:hypothetical protein
MNPDIILSVLALAATAGLIASLALASTPQPLHPIGTPGWDWKEWTSTGNRNIVTADADPYAGEDAAVRLRAGREPIAVGDGLYVVRGVKHLWFKMRQF